MRDVSNKPTTLRTAVAEAVLRMSTETVQVLRDGTAPKGDPLPVARTAGMLAAKDTPRLIPYCHSVPIDQVLVDFELEDDRVRCRSFVKGIYRTGVEIEAITAASIAALTIYDMLKMLDDGMWIEGVRVLEKTGGKSQLTRPKGLHAAVLVISDSVSAGTATDRSGAAIVERLGQEGVESSEPEIVPDEPERVAEAVERLSREHHFLVTTGGTGISPRDRTPEAVAPLLDRRLPGVEEAIRSYGQARTPYSMMSRSIAGVRGDCVILCLPGSVSGVVDGLNAVLPALLHASGVIGGEGHPR